MHTGAEPAALGPYLARVLGDPWWRDCRTELIPGGRSNLTYVVSGPPGELVLRRPPLGHVLPTAHDMGREFRVMSALAPTRVPVPRTRHLCTDPSVLGAPFYLMERVPGVVLRGELPPGVADTPAERAGLAEAFVGVLADLHAVDPGSVGLDGFGRPDGFLARQVRRWTAQWEATRVRDDGGLDALLAALGGQLPDSGPPGIVHGDYRLDNVIVRPGPPPTVAAVLDWEMSTLGDPLTDLGLLCVYWQQDGDDPLRRDSLVVPSVTCLPGFPTRAELVAWYAARTGRDVSALPWYVAFGCAKLAVVCAGIAARGRGGAMLGEGFVEMADRVAPLAVLGRTVLRTGDATTAGGG